MAHALHVALPSRNPYVLLRCGQLSGAPCAWRRDRHTGRALREKSVRRAWIHQNAAMRVRSQAKRCALLRICAGDLLFVSNCENESGKRKKEKRKKGKKGAAKCLRAAALHLFSPRLHILLYAGPDIQHSPRCVHAPRSVCTVQNMLLPYPCTDKTLHYYYYDD